MRKNDHSRHRATPPLLMPQAARLLSIGLCFIYLSLFRLLYEIQQAAPFTEAAAARFGAMLEYPAVSLALLTALTFLADRVSRAERDT